MSTPVGLDQLIRFAEELRLDRRIADLLLAHPSSFLEYVASLERGDDPPQEFSLLRMIYRMAQVPEEYLDYELWCTASQSAKLVFVESVPDLRLQNAMRAFGLRVPSWDFNAMPESGKMRLCSISEIETCEWSGDFDPEGLLSYDASLAIMAMQVLDATKTYIISRGNISSYYWVLTSVGVRQAALQQIIHGEQNLWYIKATAPELLKS